jgi:hypothetical protein
MRTLSLGLLLLGATSASAIYPADHWTYSTKLTGDNFDATVQSAVDSDTTLFVRWIASEG